MQEIYSITTRIFGTMRDSATGFIDPCSQTATATRAYRSEKPAAPILKYGLGSEKQILKSRA